MSTHCSHGVSFRDPCGDCDRVWHEAMVRSLHRDAARLGFRVVPVIADKMAAVEPGAVEVAAREQAAREAALRDAAAEVDCGCKHRSQVLARLADIGLGAACERCPRYRQCGALQALDILALIDGEAAPNAAR